MEDNFIYNDNSIYNDLEDSSYENPKIKKSNTYIYNMNYRKTNKEKNLNPNESNKLEYNGILNDDENIQDKENQMNNSQNNNYYRNLSKDKILNKSLNININYNKIILAQIKPKPRCCYQSDKIITGYSNFFLNDKRALIGEKNYKTNIIFNSTRKRDEDSKNNLTYNYLDKKESRILNNYELTYSNTKVMKIKKGPRDEINYKNFKKNLNLALGNTQYNKNNIYKTNTNTYNPRENYITKIIKLPTKKIYDNHLNNNDTLEKTNYINEKEEAKKDFEFRNRFKSFEYPNFRKSLSSNDLNSENYERFNYDNKPKIKLKNKLFSKENINNVNEDENQKEREKYKEISLFKNKDILYKSYSTSINNNFINVNSTLNRPKSKVIKINKINNQRKTTVKKLSLLKSINNIGKIDNELKEEKEINHDQIINQPELRSISNDLDINKLSKKQNITVKKLKNRIIPFQNDSKVLNNINQNENISKVLWPNDNNRNKMKNSFNLFYPNLQYQKVEISRENNIQILQKENIKRKNIYLKEQTNNLYNQNPQKPFISNNIKNQIIVQDNINQKERDQLPKQENQKIYLSNNLNQKINNYNIILPNDGGPILPNKKNIINNNELIKNKEENEEVIEVEEIEEIEEVENKNIDYKSKNNKNLNLFYKDFDNTGLLINYGGVSRPGKDITGHQKINQDSIVTLTNINNIKDFNIFGVLDGHGPQGHFVSQFASKFIPSQIFNNPEIKNNCEPEKIYKKLKENNCKIIINAFITCDEQLKTVDFDSYSSGSTCVLIIHIGNHIICANSGDSRAIVVYDEQGDLGLNSLKSAQLSKDYKPEIPEETNRILMSGGEVRHMINEFGFEIGPYRVYIKGTNFPGLAMSRSIGDLKIKTFGVIPHPGISEYDLNNLTKYIVICSDGVWDQLSNEIVKDLGKNYYVEDNPSQFCHQLVNNSVIQWQSKDIVIDDITAVVMFF